MAIRRPHISIITLNVNELNSPINRHRVEECMTKQNPTICCLQKTHLSFKDKYRLKVKGWKMIFQANGIQKKSGNSITNIKKIDFEIEKVKKDTEGHFIMKKGIMHQEEATLINIYTLNQGAPKYTKQLLTELKEETDQNTITVEDLNTSLSYMDRLSKQEINEEITSLNDTLDKLDIIDIYRAFHPKTAAFTFFSSAHVTFSRIDHLLEHRDSLNTPKRVEIIPTIFSDHNALKLEINCTKKAGRTINTWRLKNMLLKSNWVREEIKRKIERYTETNVNSNTIYQKFWDMVKAVIIRKFVSLQVYLQKQE
uniref:Uncharacterized protein n=1 Tax=Rousettus aegyptiacus TaxID=9407 RepID=A0A7J8HSJ2_ROUAE|nr:hypothetical protein HJG63_011016 [Rousettus aegyptiacus]